jgi:hypothetical protein
MVEGTLKLLSIQLRVCLSEVFPNLVLLAATCYTCWAQPLSVQDETTLDTSFCQPWPLRRFGNVEDVGGRPTYLLSTSAYIVTLTQWVGGSNFRDILLITRFWTQMAVPESVVISQWPSVWPFDRNNNTQDNNQQAQSVRCHHVTP